MSTQNSSYLFFRYFYQEKKNDIPRKSFCIDCICQLSVFLERQIDHRLQKDFVIVWDRSQLLKKIEFSCHEFFSAGKGPYYQSNVLNREEVYIPSREEKQAVAGTLQLWLLFVKNNYVESAAVKFEISQF